MSDRLPFVLLGGLLLLLALVPAASATSVSVRIVGDAVGIESVVETTDAVVPGGCPGHSAGGAIDKAVDGNWDRMAFVKTILGEKHEYAANDYWNLWINDAYSTRGICEYTVSPGDRILMLVQRDDANFKATVFPLAMAGVPSTLTAGQPFTVAVAEQRYDGVTTTTPTPIAGATVAGGGASAQTDAAGRATLTIATPGQFTVRATRAGNVASDAFGIAVTAPAAGAAAAPPAPAPAVVDRGAPVTAIRGIRNGQRFARGAGPRKLQAQIEDPSGLLAVKLRLTRNDRGRCTYFSGKAERFRRNDKNACNAAAGSWFAVGAATTVDYLLPAKLPRGRYVLDVNAIDKARNRDDARRRGANRVVFHVG